MKKILVVDDSTFQRKTIVNFLKENPDYEIEEAINGKNALEVLTTFEADIIVSDLLMPVMDGFSLLKKLRENNDTRPIIILTSNIQEPTRVKCLDMGASAFLNKPFNSADIQKVIENL